MAMPKRLLALALFACTAAASDTDGGHAPPRRWTHPCGPASGSSRSLARAAESFGGIIWSYRAKKSIVAPPVTWDGVAFVIDGKSLVALDTATGKKLGRIAVDVADPRPAVDESSVFLREGARLAQYKHQGKRFARRWSFNVGADAGHPRILNGEIYVPSGKGLYRLRAGSRKPVWVTEGNYRGEPAVFRDMVYALRDTGGKLMLVMHKRSDGTKVSECEVGDAARKGGRVVMTDGLGAVLLPPHANRAWALVAADGKKVSPIRTVKLHSQPTGGRSMFLALDAKDRWAILQKKGSRPLVSKQQRPDLVEGAPGCIFLSPSIICFGTWAADVNANRIFWHLSERKDVSAFAKGLDWIPVPAGHERLLVVPRGSKYVHAIGPEKIG